MQTFTAVIERCPDTGLLVGYVPGIPGAHSQADSLDELNQNLKEVMAMLLEDGDRSGIRSSWAFRPCRLPYHAQVTRAEAARSGFAFGETRFR